MKTFLPLLGILSVTVTGCADMLYSNHPAPVTNQNAYYGQQPAPVLGSQPQPRLKPSPYNDNSSADMTNRRYTAEGQYGNMAQQNPVRADQTRVSGPSPYQQHPPVASERPPAIEDGWSVRPNSAPQAAEAGLVDTPKIAEKQPESKAPVAAVPAPVQEGPRPVRPVVVENNEPPRSAPQNSGKAPAAAADNDNRQVAAATPPRQENTRPSGQSATGVLLKQASAALGKGDLDGAVAYLKDAERIEPGNVKIQYDIANIRYHQGRYSEAEAAASRAVRTGGSNAMMKKAWSLIANARKALGDNQGAITAAEKAASH